RELSPGVWLPFRETRALSYASGFGTNQRPAATERNKRQFRRTELVVEEARTDVDLAERFTQLLPREGERVQDQRFAVPVDTKYRAGRSDDEIRALADAEYKKRL